MLVCTYFPYFQYLALKSRTPSFNSWIATLSKQDFWAIREMRGGALRACCDASHARQPYFCLVAVLLLACPTAACCTDFWG